MSLNFPSSPSLNDTYTLGSRTWKFNGNGWEVVPTPGLIGFTGSQGGTGSRIYTVTNSGTGAYVIDGANNPTLNLLRGFTYEFDVNASGHPFWIQTVSGAYSSGNVYNNGVTNNGAAVGKIIFAVPFDAPNTLYYACQFHSSMAGTINITDVGPEGPQGDAGFTGSQGDIGPIGYTGSAGSGGAGGGAGSSYISLVMTGTITTPFVGTSRFYPPKNLSITEVYASVTLATTAGAFTFVLKKNGVDLGTEFSIAQGQNIMTPVSVNATLLTTDYLTLDVTGASTTDLFVNIEYINTL